MCCPLAQLYCPNAEKSGMKSFVGVYPGPEGIWESGASAERASVIPCWNVCMYRRRTVVLSTSELGPSVSMVEGWAAGSQNVELA